MTFLPTIIPVSQIATFNGSLESPCRDNSNGSLFGLIALVIQKRQDFEIWAAFGFKDSSQDWQRVMSKQALKGGRLEPDHNGQALTAQCLGSTSSNVMMRFCKT